MFGSLLLFTVLLAAGTGGQEARAQGLIGNRLSAEGSHTSVSSSTRRVRGPDRKNKTAARLWARGATAVPLAVAYLGTGGGEDSPAAAPIAFGIGVAGVIVGPSAGSLYAHDGTRAVRGMAIRAGIVGAMALTLDTEAANPSPSRVGLFVVELLALGGSMAYDIRYASAESVDDYNEIRSVSVQVAPAAGPTGDQAGLALWVAF